MISGDRHGNGRGQRTGSGPGSARPRLTPGVPAGGVAAIFVTLSVVAWSLAAGPAEETREIRIVHAHPGADMPAPPIPPIPPAAPVAPVRPAPNALAAPSLTPPADAPGAEAIGEPDVDGRAIAGTVKALVKEAETRAVALANSYKGRDGEIDYLERYENNKGENRLTAEAVAPAGLRLADVNGSVAIRVDPQARAIRFTMVNSRKRYTLAINEGVLWITGPGPDSRPETDFTITVPRGTPLLVNGFVGSLRLEGDLDAPARLELRRGEMEIASPLPSARVRINETGTVRLGTVTDLLAVQVNGAGQVDVGSAGRLAADIGGAGTVRAATVGEALVLNLPGKSEVAVGTLAGALRANVPGHATVAVGSGRAEPFEVDMAGAGSVTFGGTAVAPQVVMSGIGSVTVTERSGPPRVRRSGPGQVALGR